MNELEHTSPPVSAQITGSISSQLREIAGTLDALMRVRFPADEDHPQRDALIVALLRNELREQTTRPLKFATLDELIATAEVAPDDIATIRNRCLFYGCDSLVGFLVNKRIRYDAIAREEATLYVQDRLQRDDFRRIRVFAADRGANFVTYIWQVISNLLLDFLRAHGKQSSQSIEVGAKPEGNEDFANHNNLDTLDHESSDTLIEAQKLRELLAEVLSSERSATEPHALRDRLRPHLSLSSKERVFLKALFQYDMSIAEVRELPGFSMTTNEAYRLYYRIMDQLRIAFKNAGLLGAMRELVSDTVPRVALSVEGQNAVVAVTQIYYLAQVDRATGCHLTWKQAVAPGLIPDSYNKVSKRLSSYFTPIDSTTAVSDKLLAAAIDEWKHTGKLVISGVTRPFRISARALGELQRRFSVASSEKLPP